MTISRIARSVPFAASLAGLVWGCTIETTTIVPAGSDAGALDSGELTPGDAAKGDAGKGKSCVTTITGSVYDPAGKNPLYNVMVYVPARELDPIATGPSCDERCGALPAGLAESATLSNAKGEFTLTTKSVAADAKEASIVIQTGKWRRRITLPSIEPCRNNVIANHDLTRLPKSQAEGNVPRIALVTSPLETPECLLRKMGIADTEFTGSGGGQDAGTGAGRVHIFKSNGGGTAAGGSLGSRALYESKSTLFNYDMVYLGCEAQEPYNDTGTSSGIEAVARAAIYDYANAGGRLLTSHFGYYWLKYGPQGPNGNFRSTAAWVTSSPFSSSFTIETSFPKGQAFSDWLGAVSATATPGTIALKDTRDDVGVVGPGTTAWIKGATATSATKAFSFNTPVGTAAPQACGRVTFTDVHVGSTDTPATFPLGCTTPEMSPQEKALEFLFFDLACVMDDTQAPPTPQ